MAHYGQDPGQRGLGFEEAHQMRGRKLARIAAVVQLCLLAGALIVPSSVAAATLAFSLNTPSMSTGDYSDFVVLRGSYTCLDDGVSDCPTTVQSFTATFSVRPNGGSTFSNVGTVSSSFVFTTDPGGCASACSFDFQLTWKAGRAGSASVPPGHYDIGLTSTIGLGQQVLLDAVTVTKESTTTTYGGGTTGLAGTTLALSANVVDTDLGQVLGTGIFFPDANLLGSNKVTFELFDATNATSLAGPVSATVLGNGNTTGTPSLLLPAAGGTYKLRTTYLGNTYYTTSSDLDTVTVTASNTPPVLTVPASPLVTEASSPAGAYRTFTVSATDAEDVPPPTPTCDHASGSLFAIGDTTVNCTVTDSGLLNDADSFVVRVVDTTDPGIAVSTDESDNGAGWYNVASNDEVPGVTVQAITADLVGVTSLTCTVDGLDVGALDPSGDSFVIGDGSHTVSCTATDAAGNHHSDSASLNVDQTPPSISATVSPGAAGTGWWNLATGVPTVTYSCSDGGSGLASCSPAHLFGEGADQSDIGTATDVAGNAAMASVSNIDVDLTPPTISASVSPSAAATGWWNLATGAPIVTYSCSDAASGLASCSAPHLFGDGSGLGDTGTVVDNAGNMAIASVSNLNVDLIAPTGVSFVGGSLVNGTSYVFGSVPAGPTGCSANGGTSGLFACIVSGYSVAVGPHTVSGVATDNAGNPSMISLSYTVLPWTLVGFSGASMTSMNHAKAGSSVNLKFQVFAGSVELTSLSVVTAFTQTQLSCSTLLAIAPTTSALASPAASLKYASQFQAKWDPPNAPGTCWRVAIVTTDGSSLKANFQLK